MSGPTEFEPNPISRKLLSIRGQENSRKSVEHDQKLFRSGEPQNELVHQIWAQCDQRFVCKCVETAQSIIDQGTAEIQWNVTTS